MSRGDRRSVGPEPSRWRRRCASAAVVILITISPFAILEAGLRSYPPAWLEFRMAELNAGSDYEAGSDEGWPAIVEDGVFRQFAPRSTFVTRHYEYEYVANTDEWGGRATPADSDSGAIIPFVGDSFTFGLGVADSETFVSLLAAESPHRLLNLGVPGSGLHDHLNIVEMRHAELGAPPFYVFVVFKGNDLSDVWVRHQRVNRAQARSPGLAFRANLYVFHNPVLKRVYAIQYLRQKALTLMNRDGAFMEPVFLAMRSDRTYRQEALVHWQRELQRLAELSRDRGFRYVFLLIPDVNQLDDRRRAAKAESLGLSPSVLDPAGLSRAFTRTIEQLGATYVDIEPCFAAAWTNGLYYKQDDHWTAAGHRLAARCALEGGLMDLIEGATNLSGRSGTG